MDHKTQTPLRVLFIEDSEDDVLLEVAEFEKAGFQLRYMCVDNQNMLEEVLEKDWDIVLSDYKLPDFNGTRALEIIRQHAPKIPVILISGVIKDQQAVEVIEAGAQNYISKNDMSKLIPAVQRELREARLRQQHEVAQRSLQESELQYRTLVEFSPDIIYRFSNINGGIYYSPRVEEILGYSPEMLKADNMLWHDSIHPDDLPMVDAAIKEFSNGGTYDLEYRIKGANGNWLWFHDRNFAIHQSGEEIFSDGLASDITEQKESQQRILKALHEKEALLRELHHRVMNNMQIISSILSLQSRHANISDPRQLLDESRHRIRAMALIHERMYSSANLARVNFLDYMRYLSDHLTRMYHSPYGQVDIHPSGDILELSVDQALPCALVVNELITNAIKHAYPDSKEKRRIELTLQKLDGHINRIIVRDYGTGIPETVVKDEPDTLGLLIIMALSKQIGASITFENNGGTIATLQFADRETIVNGRVSE